MLTFNTAAAAGTSWHCIYTLNQVAYHQLQQLIWNEGRRMTFILFALRNSAACELQSPVKCCSVFFFYISLKILLLQMSSEYHNRIMRLYPPPLNVTSYHCSGHGLLASIRVKDTKSCPFFFKVMQWCEWALCNHLIVFPLVKLLIHPAGVALKVFSETNELIWPRNLYKTSIYVSSAVYISCCA